MDNQVVQLEGKGAFENISVKEPNEPFSDDSEKKNISLMTSQIVVPRTIIGPAHLLNKGAVDWGHHGLMSYGSNNTVVVVDTKNVQIIQTLDCHKSVVKKILWVPGIESKTDGTTSLHLVSGDTSGHIIYWDVSSGEVISVVQDGNKPVLGMAWVPGLENELMLAAVHSPYFLIIWDIKKQSKLWKKSFTDTLLSFDFDPFSNNKIAFLCPDCILFVDDFQIGKIPSTNGRKFYISSPRLDGTAEDTSRGRERLKRLMRGMVVGETKPRPEEGMTLSECLQLSYHRSLRDHLILLYPRDVILIDLHINQTIGIVPIERTMSPLIQVITCRQRDVLYCLHESGSVGIKIRKKQFHPTSPLDITSNTDNSTADLSCYCSEMFMCYEHKFQSESIRQLKGSKVLAMSLDPVSERRIGLTLSSGKVVFLELEQSVNNNNNYLSFTSLCDIVPVNGELNQNCRLMVGSMVNQINGSMTVAKMCPPLTAKTRAHYLPLLAIGTNTGYIYICNLSLGTVTKEFSIHAHPVRGLEWTGPRSILTYGFNDGSKVKNEMYVTDLRTGHSLPIRTDRPPENPIHLVRVSPLRQYFVVVLKDGPFELWELTPNIGLLRTMPKKFPFVVALEWSPIHNVKSMQSKRKLSKDETDNCKIDKGRTQEHVVFSDNVSQLYHFSVGEDNVKDGIKIPPDMGVNMVTSLAFKANQIVQGDMDGVLNMWDLKERSSRNMATGRGPIRYIRFAPGKTNLKLLVLYLDGLDIIHLKQNQYEKVSQLKLGRETSKIVDADWASSDLPVIVTDDGWIKVLDLQLTRSASALLAYNLPEPISCPYLLPQKSLNKIQFLLCTQYWKDVPKLKNFTTADGFTPSELSSVNGQIEMMEMDLDMLLKMNTAQKCLYTSRILGDMYGIDFWTVTIYYLQVAAAITSQNSSNNKSEVSEESSSRGVKRINKYGNIEPLDTCYDFLMDPYSYQRVELERVGAHEWKRGDYQHTQRVVQRLVLLGETDRAVQLLLDTDIDNPNYYTDAIKACLVATIQQTGAAQSTIKLVATNLIANGKVWEGVQLLCLIGKGLDGCRYLVSSGLWESAVWLAKAILPDSETLEVMKKYADHLASTGDKFGAILVLISQCQFDKALEMLFSQHQILSAALLLLSCKEYNIPISHELSTSVYSLLGDYLTSIGNMDAAAHFLTS